MINTLKDEYSIRMPCAGPRRAAPHCGPPTPAGWGPAAGRRLIGNRPGRGRPEPGDARQSMTACSSTRTSTGSSPSRRRPCSTSSRAATASSRCTAPRTASSTRRSTSSLVGAQFQKPRHRHLRHDDRRAGPPDHEGLRAVRKLGRDLRPHQAQRARTATSWSTATRADREEPWTWVRTQGKGRVFYTAWGHDQRTWGNPGFQDLVERGIRWAVGTRARSSTAGRGSPAGPASRSDVRRARDVGRSPTTAGPEVGRAGRAAHQDAAAARPGRVDQAHGRAAGFDVELFAAEPDDRQADLHDLGRARPALDRRDGRLSERPAAARPGPRPHRDLRRHRRRRPGRQVHRLRREAEHPDEPHVLPTAA